MNKRLFLMLSLFYVGVLFGQNGISGTVNDGDANDVLPFANVQIKGTLTGTTTDFEGKYAIEIDPGTYTVVFSFLVYETKEITGIVVKANQYTTVDVALNVLANTLDEVVVTTTVQKNTETSVLQLQKASVKLLDGLSLQSIKKPVLVILPRQLKAFQVFLYKVANTFM